MATTAAFAMAPPGTRRAFVGAHAPVVVAAALPLLLFLGEGRVGFGKADEGFLWYGAQRVVAGDVPLRDFQSYDIGRYYWIAAWMRVVGSDGLVALRFADAVLAACTVALATALVRGAGRRRARWLVLAGATFTAWMVPEYKVADAFACVLLVAGLARLVRAPDVAGNAAFGLCLGIAATIGINHALYGTIGGALGYVWLLASGRRPLDARRAAALCGATLVGYAPVLLFAAVVPGFAFAFVDAIRLLVEAGTTNVDAPFPRIGAIFDATSRTAVGAARESLLAAAFVAAPVFVVAALAAARRAVVDGVADADAGRPTRVAALLLALPYAHYAASSPGFMHVAISALPLLLALWTLPFRAPRRAAFGGVALFGASLFVCANAWDGYQALRGRATETVVVRGDTLRTTHDAAAEVRLVQRLVAAHPGRAFFAGHDWPGAYAIAGTRAPNWEVYQVFPARPERQRREIERIAAAAPAFAIVTAGRAAAYDDGLEKTHPLVVDYLERCFVRQPPEPADPPATVVYLAGASCARAAR